MYGPPSPSTSVVSTNDELHKFLAYVPWWYVVWVNYWRVQRKKRPFLSRRVHIGGEVVALATTLAALGLTALVARCDALLVVGFSHTTTMAALFGIQM